MPQTVTDRETGIWWGQVRYTKISEQAGTVYISNPIFVEAEGRLEALGRILAVFDILQSETDLMGMYTSLIPPGPYPVVVHKIETE